MGVPWSTIPQAIKCTHTYGSTSALRGLHLSQFPCYLPWAIILRDIGIHHVQLVCLTICILNLMDRQKIFSLDFSPPLTGKKLRIHIFYFFQAHCASSSLETLPDPFKNLVIAVWTLDQLGRFTRYNYKLRGCHVHLST